MGVRLESARQLSGLILAAGQGSRLGGRPKALLRYRNEFFIDRLVRTLRESGCSSIVVVLGSAADEVLQTAQLHDVYVVINPDWESGMSSSLQLGVANIDPRDGDVIISVVDQPDVSKDSVARLRAWHRSGRITVPTFSERPGHPVLFDTALAHDAAVAARGDVGARDFVRLHPEVVDYVDCSDIGSGLDVDTSADLQAFTDGLTIRDDLPAADNK